MHEAARSAVLAGRGGGRSPAPAAIGDAPVSLALQAGEVSEIPMHEARPTVAAALLGAWSRGASIAGLPLEGRYDRVPCVFDVRRAGVRWLS